MDTASLSRGQEVDSPPAHLQEDKREYQPSEQEVLILIGRTEVQIKQIAEPSGKGPCFLGIPCPIVAPGFLGPQGAHRHAQREESPPYSYQAIAHGQFLTRCFLGRFPEPQIQGKQGHGSHHGIREHIYNDMRNEPHALKRRHQGRAMNLGLEQIDAHKHHGHERTEPQNPFVPDLLIEHHTNDGQEERIPQAGLSHGSHRRAFQVHPHAYDESQEDQRTHRGDTQSPFPTPSEGQGSAHYPAQGRHKGIDDKRIPAHFFFFLCPTKNIITPPIRIVHMATWIAGYQASFTHSSTLVVLHRPFELS